jgi:hypothetical protein
MQKKWSKDAVEVSNLIGVQVDHDIDILCCPRDAVKGTGEAASHGEGDA